MTAKPLKPMRAIALLLLGFFATAALADIYSWRDADGSVQYGDVPPPGAIGIRKLHAPGAPAAELDQARRAQADKELASKKRKLDAEEAAANAEKEKTASEDRQRNCTQAKSYLRALESGERISRTQENGERAYLDDQARAQETESARRAVDSWCK